MVWDFVLIHFKYIYIRNIFHTKSHSIAIISFLRFSSWLPLISP